MRRVRDLWSRLQAWWNQATTTTTGTAENDLFVGRVAGQDVGYAEETGAEARSFGNTSRGGRT